MNDEERFRFDLNGYLVRESILTPAQIAAMRDQIHAITHDPASLPPEHRWAPSGPTEMLIDHPRILDVLHEVIGPQLRIDSNFAIWRGRGQEHGQGLHQGGGGPMQADPIVGYRVENGRIHAGMVRVIVELTDIDAGDGATQFLPGTHKSNFPVHAEHQSLDEPSEFLRGYSCPAGSVVFFTENLCHAGPRWNKDEPRVAVLLAYMHVSIQFSRIMTPPAVLEAMCPQRRAYFREPWLFDFTSTGALNTVERFVESGGRTPDTSHLAAR